MREGGARVRGACQGRGGTIVPPSLTPYPYPHQALLVCEISCEPTYPGDSARFFVFEFNWVNSDPGPTPATYNAWARFFVILSPFKRNHTSQFGVRCAKCPPVLSEPFDVGRAVACLNARACCRWKKEGTFSLRDKGLRPISGTCLFFFLNSIHL